MCSHVKSWHTASAVPREWLILRWSDKKPAEAFEICTGVSESWDQKSWITIIQCTSVVVRIDISFVSWTGMRIWILRTMGRRCTCNRWNLYIGRTSCALLVCVFCNCVFEGFKMFFNNLVNVFDWRISDVWISILRSYKWNAKQKYYVYQILLHVQYDWWTKRAQMY